ncbi:hypothetical protein OEA41_000935 [Lepraria neglecta]|uniref:Uncharacterized protein n=1 Tax=Lepraria neglecta TaxID=209136 RepID=A0AAE0DRM6_9LECA|nr:hypothetical protein OEA41_000935 [Lepraria neglecta]
MLQDTYKVPKSYRELLKNSTTKTYQITNSRNNETHISGRSFHPSRLSHRGPILERSTVYDERNDNTKRNLVARQKNYNYITSANDGQVANPEFKTMTYPVPDCNRSDLLGKQRSPMGPLRLVPQRHHRSYPVHFARSPAQQR